MQRATLYTPVTGKLRRGHRKVATKTSAFDALPPGEVPRSTKKLPVCALISSFLPTSGARVRTSSIAYRSSHVSRIYMRTQI